MSRGNSAANVVATTSLRSRVGIRGATASTAAASVALAMAACSAPSQESPEDPESQENVTLTYWTFSDFTVGEAGALQSELIEQFEADNPGISVDLVGKSGSDIVSGVAATAGMPSAPDIITGQLAAGASLAAAGAFLDLTDYWGAETAEFREQFSPAFVETLSLDGPVWGVPYSSYSTVLYRNLDVLAAAGIDTEVPISDWADWQDQLERVSSSGASGLANPFATYWEALSYYGGVPGVSFELDETGASTLDVAALGDALAFMQRSLSTGSQVPTGDQTETDLFVANQLAFIVSGPWLNPALEEAAAAGLKYDAVPVPGRDSTHTGGTRGGEFLGIGAGTPNPDAAWKFVKFMTDAPQAAKFGVGLGRTMANDAAMSSPEAEQVALLQVTTRAFSTAVDESPLMRDVPNSAYDALNNALTAVKGGADPFDEAQRAVESFNAALAAAT